jgi:DNA-binding response OmpR family regulator
VFQQKEREGMHEEYLLEIEDVFIDRARRTVRQGSHLLAIKSPVLFDLLVYLVLHRGTVLPREQLLRSVWGYNPANMHASDVRTVDVHVHWLRELLHDNAENPHWIQTVRGVGYRFRDEE